MSNHLNEAREKNINIEDISIGDLFIYGSLENNNIDIGYVTDIRQISGSIVINWMGYSGEPSKTPFLTCDTIDTIKLKWTDCRYIPIIK